MIKNPWNTYFNPFIHTTALRCEILILLLSFMFNFNEVNYIEVQVDSRSVTHSFTLSLTLSLHFLFISSWQTQIDSPTLMCHEIPVVSSRHTVLQHPGWKSWVFQRHFILHYSYLNCFLFMWRLFGRSNTVRIFLYIFKLLRHLYDRYMFI